MKIKKLAVLFASVALAASLVTGCSSGQKETAAEAAGTADETAAPETEADESAEAAEEAKEDEENYDTGDASLDNTRNQDEMSFWLSALEPALMTTDVLRWAPSKTRWRRHFRTTL